MPTSQRKLRSSDWSPKSAPAAAAQVATSGMKRAGTPIPGDSLVNATSTQAPSAARFGLRLVSVRRKTTGLPPAGRTGSGRVVSESSTFPPGAASRSGSNRRSQT